MKNLNVTKQENFKKYEIGSLDKILGRGPEDKFGDIGGDDDLESPEDDY